MPPHGAVGIRLVLKAGLVLARTLLVVLGVASQRGSNLLSCLGIPDSNRIIFVAVLKSPATCYLFSARREAHRPDWVGVPPLGHRRDQVSPTPVPLRLEGDVNENVRIAHVAATRGQPHPKNTGFKDPAGQEGPRTHLVTSCGKLLIAGTCHKGLGLDHLGKVLTAQRDHLRFYCVGSSACVEEGKTAWGVCLTGALEGGLTPASVQAVQGAGGRSREEGGGGSNQGVHYLKDAHVTRSACASIHSFCIDSHGILRGWGCGSDGRLGLSNFFAPNGSKRLLKCYVSSPSPLDFARHRVVDVAVGRWWSFALVREHRERGEGETPGGGLDRESGLEKNVGGALTTDSATDSAEISASPGLPRP